MLSQYTYIRAHQRGIPIRKKRKKKKLNLIRTIRSITLIRLNKEIKIGMTAVLVMFARAVPPITIHDSLDTSKLKRISHGKH